MCLPAPEASFAPCHFLFLPLQAHILYISSFGDISNSLHLVSFEKSGIWYKLDSDCASWWHIYFQLVLHFATTQKDLGRTRFTAMKRKQIKGTTKYLNDLENGLCPFSKQEGYAFETFFVFYDLPKHCLQVTLTLLYLLDALNTALSYTIYHFCLQLPDQI